MKRRFALLFPTLALLVAMIGCGSNDFSVLKSRATGEGAGGSAGRAAGGSSADATGGVSGASTGGSGGVAGACVRPSAHVVWADAMTSDDSTNDQPLATGPDGSTYLMATYSVPPTAFLATCSTTDTINAGGSALLRVLPDGTCAWIRGVAGVASPPSITATAKGVVFAYTVGPREQKIESYGPDGELGWAVNVSGQKNAPITGAASVTVVPSVFGKLVVALAIDDNAQTGTVTIGNVTLPPQFNPGSLFVVLDPATGDVTGAGSAVDFGVKPEKMTVQSDGTIVFAGGSMVGVPSLGVPAPPANTDTQEVFAAEIVPEGNVLWTHDFGTDGRRSGVPFSGQLSDGTEWFLGFAAGPLGGAFGTYDVGTLRNFSALRSPGSDVTTDFYGSSQFLGGVATSKGLVVTGQGTLTSPDPNAVLPVGIGIAGFLGLLDPCGWLVTFDLQVLALTSDGADVVALVTINLPDCAGSITVGDSTFDVSSCGTYLLRISP